MDVVEFAVLSLLPILSPGPSTILVVRNAVARGWLFAAAWVLVDVFGTIVTAVTLLAWLGVIIAHSRIATAAIELAGTVYVLYYGFKCLRRTGRRAAPVYVPTGTGRRWLGTLLTGLLNPKTLVFFSLISPSLLAGSGAFGRPEWFYAAFYAALKAVALWGLAWAAIQVGMQVGQGAARVQSALGCLLVGFGSYLFFHITSHLLIGNA